MNFKKTISLALSAVIFSGSAAFANEEYMSRGDAAKYLLERASYYNPAVKVEDIIKGYETGELREDENVSKVQAFAMLKRAFGKLPEISGHNKRVAYPKEEYTDIPAWAKSELDSIFDAGVASAGKDGMFDSDSPVTEDEMNKMIKRVYSIFGTNKKDDFYATINKQILNNLDIRPGRVKAGTLYDMSYETDDEVGKIIDDVLANGTFEKGSESQKIADMYYTIMDKEGREKVGLTPILQYIEEINSVNSMEELDEIQNKLTKELATTVHIGFSLTVDDKDSTKYILTFGTEMAGMDKEFYEQKDEKKTKLYLDYIKNALMYSGESEEQATNEAQTIYDFEAYMAENSLDVQEYYDVDKTYNLYSLNELQKLFPSSNLQRKLDVIGFDKEDKYLVQDKGAMEAFAKFYTAENLETLKIIAKSDLIFSCGSMLDDRYIENSKKFKQDFYGIEGSYTDEERAKLSVQSIMNFYIGKLYAEKFFDEASKEDVIDMIKTIISTYKQRIDELSWMSSETKEKAKEKLNKITIKVGYPDKWDSYMDNVDIKSIEEGGTYFSNILAISKASTEYCVSLQGTEVDKTKWVMNPFTINACYNFTSNDITFPAAILQAPFYDVNASKEENYGGIGYIIAHEITHAFDNNGAKYDANGNVADWWQEQDYEAFGKLCEKMQAFYDGEEIVTGIECDGERTLSENIADQGSCACITQIVSQFENPDYDKLFTSIAKVWASTASRDTIKYYSQSDVHSNEKLRVNKVLQNNDKFYETYDIKSGDGMYVQPENRVKIW